MGSTIHTVRRAAGARAGFTAIEVTAVVTIIAILALVLIPIMRSRVEEARVAAATEDMLGLDKAQSLAFAYTGKYFRTFDLALSQAGVGEEQKLPKAFWNRAVTDADLPNLFANFKGPFAAAQSTMSVEDAITFFPHLFRGDQGSGGPILIVAEDDEDETGPTGALARRRLPIDPWGSPYLFFGSGVMGTIGNPADSIGAETNFSTAAVYSLGPNGAAADEIADLANPALYFRVTPTGTGVLGRQGSDDMVRLF